MATLTSPIPAAATQRQIKSPPTGSQGPAALHVLLIVGVWLVIFMASLGTPPLLDDADATHAQAAQAMLTIGDWVTLHVDGVRYLEKAPLPYWITALSLRLFTSPATLAARAAFAVHLPLALTVLGLALLAFAWARRAFGSTAALYAAVFTLTSAGVFLFTRIFIPDALLSLLLAAVLYSFLRALEPATRLAAKAHAHLWWAFLALAVLTKGLVALVLFFGSALVFLAVTRQLGRWRELAPVTGPLLLLAIAAPWHVLAGVRNTGGAGGHGFLWFYFVNEHVLRFLGERIPRDYNKLPAALYWSLHLVWLFPWSLFAPAALACARQQWAKRSAPDFGTRTVLLLAIFSALVLVFFSLSTNQEYYTFPAYLPLLMLLAAALAQAQHQPHLRVWMNWSYAAFAATGAAVAVALGCGLWAARGLPFVSDIGSVLAHRGVGGYTLSMSHFFDLTGHSFAALRLPAAMAAIAFGVGPAIAWTLHARRKPQAALLTVAATSAVFLVAAHIALVRFAPMLSSRAFAATIEKLETERRIAPGSEVLLYGDQAFGSSIPFYLQRRVLLVDGRSTSMLFGSTFQDVPKIFLTPRELAAQWGVGARKLLFVPLEQRDAAEHLLGASAILLQEVSGKALLTDRPLDAGRNVVENER